MKTKDVVEAYKALKNAKLTKVPTNAKMKIIKIALSLSKVSAQWDEFSKTVFEKCKGESHDAMVADLQKWQNEGNQTSLPIERRIAISQYMTKYNEETARLLDEENNKEVDMSFEKISEEVFNAIIDSNDFDIETVMPLYDVIVNK